MGDSHRFVTIVTNNEHIFKEHLQGEARRRKRGALDPRLCTEFSSTSNPSEGHVEKHKEWEEAAFL